MRLRLASLLLLVLGLLAALPTASQAAVTIGSALTTPGTENLGTFCQTAPCTATNVLLPPAFRAPAGLTSPITGVVVRWSVRSGSSDNPIRLRILRPAPSSPTFTGVGSSDQALTSATTPGTPPPSFATRVAIRAGDSIGLNAQNGALVFGATDGTTSSVLWGAGNMFTMGLRDSVTAMGTPENNETLVQAVVEPDADRDGYGDETQDACPADPARQAAPCTTAGTGTPPGGSAPDTTAPTVSGLGLSPTTLHLGGTARLRFTVSERARVSLTYARLTSGRRSGTRCLAPRRNRTGRRCTRTTHIGTQTVQVTRSASLAFAGRVGGHTLSVGRYRVTATASDAAGNVSTPRSTTFEVRPRAKRVRR